MRKAAIATAVGVMLAVPAVQAVVYSYNPRIEFSEEARAKCIDGKIIFNIYLADGYPVEVEILRSEPDGFYTEVFLEYWAEVIELAKSRAPRWKMGEVDDEFVEPPILLRPCDT